MIRGAIELYLESLAEEGEPIPQPGTWSGAVEVKAPSPTEARLHEITKESSRGQASA